MPPPPIAQDEPDSLIPEALDAAVLDEAGDPRRTASQIVALTWPLRRSSGTRSAQATQNTRGARAGSRRASDS